MKHLIIALASASLLHAQGPLTPPGAPAPGMKTLQQIEPRTPISSLPFTISQSGSYYLTESLVLTDPNSDGITIQASGVTLDLMGFTLSSGAAATGRAIYVPPDSPRRGICVKNGIITGKTTVTSTGNPQVWTIVPAGFHYGVYDTSANGRYENLIIIGCRTTGIFANSGAVISNVSVSQNGSTGIMAPSGSVTNSTSSYNGYDGIDADSGSVTNSVCKNNSHDGIVAYHGSVTNSTGSLNGSKGISSYLGSVTNSIGSFNGTKGIDVGGGSVSHSSCSFNRTIGIDASSGSVTSCSATNNTTVDLEASQAVVAFCKFGTSNLSGATRTGNHPSP